jgi:hypothetical protein
MLMPCAGRCSMPEKAASAETAPVEPAPVPPPVVHARAHPVLLVAILLLLISGFGAGAYFLQRQNVLVYELKSSLKQHGALLRGAMGKAVPVHLSEAEERKLREIEAELARTDQLLNSPEKVEALTAKLAAVVDAMQPWVQAELFHRIVPARWQLEAHGLLHRAQPELPVPSGELQGLVDALSAHALNRPQNAPEKLEEILLKRAEEAGERLKQIDESESAERERVAVLQSVKDRVKALESDLTHFDGLPTPELKARWVVDTQYTLQGLQVVAVTSQLQDGELTAKLLDLSDEVAKRSQQVNAQLQSAQAELSRKYQMWALEKLSSVPELKTITEQKMKTVEGMRKRFMSAEKDEAERAAQAELSQELIAKLSIIDARLLDDAVGEWYRKVFSSRFNSLDGTNQLRVVKGFAESIKQTPGNLP